MLQADIAGSIEVRVQLKTTSFATEDRLTGTVSPVNMTTAGAGFGGVTRVNIDHADSLLLGFVLDEASELSKAPGVKASGLLSLALFDSLSNVGQVLQNDRPSRSGSRDNLFAKDVILVPPSPKLFAGEPLQVAFGALCAFGLESTLKPEGTRFHFFPVPLTQEAIVGGDGGAGDSQVYPDNIGRRSNPGSGPGQALGSRDIDHDMKPKLPFAGDEVCGAGPALDLIQGLGACILEGILGDLEGDDQTAICRGEVDLTGFPVDPEGVQVVPDGAAKAFGLTHLPAFTFQSESGSDSLRGLDSGLDHQVRDQIGVSLSKLIVGRLVQTYPVALSCLPTHGTDVIEAGSKLLHRLHERAGLLWGWFQEKAYCSVHAVYYLIYGDIL